MQEADIWQVGYDPKLSIRWKVFGSEPILILCNNIEYCAIAIFSLVNFRNLYGLMYEVDI